ncbi:ATP-binding protein [Microbacteriaceae bacterium VKM Ac-2854]|nr:ATP-binding protein [Microbacteriaceae bacterium VKM Ac-2854]
MTRPLTHRLLDIGLVVLYVVVQLGASIPGLFAPEFVLSSALSLVTGVPVAVLLARHRTRSKGLAIALGVQLVLALPVFGGVAPVVAAVAAYGAVRSRGERAGWLTATWLTIAAVAGLGFGALVAAWPAASITITQQPLAAVVSTAVFTVLAVLVASLVAARAERTAALREGVRRAEAERDRQAELATVSERGRIAGELHDIVAHSLSVMVLLAEGAATTADPERAREVMRRVAETGRTALDDSRRALAVLGSEAETAPLPGIDGLPALVETVRAAGLPATLNIAGESIADEALQLTVYRIVQEALTNALRHATDPSAVTVRIRNGSGAVAVDVRDDGSGTPGPSRADARGVVGMRERVIARGGTFSAGPVEPRGWCVSATIPAVPR